MTTTKKIRALLCLACAVVSLPATPVHAQELDRSSVHWAYSSYFGTGWYRVDGQRQVFVLRTTPRWALRTPAIADDGTRTIGVEFRFPVTAGLNSFILDDLSGTVDPDNLASLSVTPGVDVTFPVTSRWSLRPFAAIGYGTIINDGESAWTYWAGVKSRFTFQHGKLDWALLNSLTYVGYQPSVGSSESFWPLLAGLEFDYPIGTYWPGGDPVILNWHATYTRFQNDLDLVSDSGLTRAITDQWELGIAFGKKDQRIRIWRFQFDRLGLAYRFSSNGDLEGISLVFRSLFDR